MNLIPVYCKVLFLNICLFLLCEQKTMATGTCGDMHSIFKVAGLSHELDNWPLRKIVLKWRDSVFKTGNYHGSPTFEMSCGTKDLGTILEEKLMVNSK